MNRDHESTWRNTLDVTATALMILASGTILAFALQTLLGKDPADPASRPSAKNLPPRPVTLNGSPTAGNAAAPVVVIEHADFECPYCREFARTILPEVRTRFIESGRVQFVYRHLPLPSHAGAVQAAEAAECAHRQGRFWEMHAALFAEPMRPNAASHSATAHALGLDESAFAACLSGAAATIKADIAAARSAGVRGAPTFLFGRRGADGRVTILRRHEGLLSIERFARLVGEVAAVPEGEPDR